MNTYPPLPRRMWNMRPWRSSPLMRASHRVEFAAHSLLLVLLAGAAVLATFVGLMTSANITTRAAQSTAGMRRVDAVVDTVPSPTRFAVGNMLEAPVHWSLGGRVHTGLAEVADDAHSGDHTTVWIRPSGDQLPAPATRADAVSDGIGAGFAVFGGSGVLAVLLDWTVCRSLARRRERAWETEWAELAGVRRWNRMW